MIAVLLVVAIACATAFALRRTPPLTEPGSGRRGSLARLACAVSALGLLAAISVGTWSTAFPPAERATALHQATLPPPPVPTENDEIAQGRVLVQAVIMRGITPLKAEEFEIHMPADARRTFERKGVVDGAAYGISISAVALYKNNASERIECDNGGFTASLRRPRSAEECSITDLLGATSLGPSCDGEAGSPWSLFHMREERLRMLVRTESIDPADPLRPTSLAELGSAMERALDGESRYHAGMSRFARHPAFIAYLNTSGPACAFALAAAILLAQLYRRRQAAFAGCLGLCLLWCAAVDRAVVAHASAIAQDAAAPPLERMAAIEVLPHTFFFAHAAAKAVESLTRDAAMSPGLRDAALLTALELSIAMGSGAANEPAEILQDL
jgi:hypothetical protein